MIFDRNGLLDIRKDPKGMILLFAIWPFAATLWALWNYELKESKKIVFLFLIYYGLTFVISTEGLDSFRYAENFAFTATLPFTDFFKIVGGIYATDTSVDILVPLLNFLLSRFTASYHILFAAFALIFGFFYLKSFNLLHDEYIKSPNRNALIHLLFFAILIPIFSINGFRFYAACWIYFYGAYFVVVNNDRRYLLICFSSALVHFSFLAPIVLLIIYVVAGNRNIIYYPLLAFSFISPIIFSSYLQKIGFLLGGGIQTRIGNYTNDAYMEDIASHNEEVKWFLEWSDKLVLYYLFAALIIIRIKYKSLVETREMQNIYSFLLLILSFVNFGSSIPSVGRFQALFYLFGVLYVFKLFLELKSYTWNWITILGLFPMFLFTALALRQGIETINAWIFTLSPYPFILPEITVYDFLYK
jgi:hypothetical protein